MTIPSVTRRLRIRRFLTLATDQRAVSWPVIFAGVVLSVLIHLAPNGHTVSGNAGVRILVAIVGYLPVLGVLWLAQLSVRRVRSENLRIAVILTSFFVGGALRGLFFSLVFFELGMATSLNLDFRIPGSAIPFGLAIALSTYAVSALDESRRRIDSLRALQAELRQAVSDSAQRESSIREQTVNRIEESVSISLSQIMGMSSTATESDLRILATDVVRPLSHALARRVPLWEGSTPTVIKPSWKDIVQHIRPEFSLQPALLATLSTATALTAFAFFFGIALAVPLAICCFATIFVTARVFQPLATRFNNLRSIIIRSLLMTLILAVAAVPAGLVAAIIVQNSNDPYFILRGGLVIVPIFGWFIAIGGASQTESARIEEEYNAGITELSWLRARINLVSWLEQGEFARLLHGPVQGAMNKAAFALHATTRKDDRTKIINSLKQDIETLLHSESKSLTVAPSLEELCADLAETWEGMCQIDLSVSPAAREALDVDRSCSAICWDIIHESCGNAVQHGGANWVSIIVNEPVDRVIKIHVIDNGTQFDVESTPGMGSNLLAACTLSWRRSREENRTILTANLPILTSDDGD